jgi:hypothetical protein
LALSDAHATASARFRAVRGARHKGTNDMRLLLGMILGVFLTIGVAYVSDASSSGSASAAGQTTIEQRPMVNWDVVSKNWQDLSLGVRNTWHKLAAR